MWEQYQATVYKAFEKYDGVNVNMMDVVKAVFEDAQSLMVGRIVTMLHGEARKAEAEGKTQAAQNVRYCATKVAEME